MRGPRAKTLVDYLRVETIGGGILLAAAALALGVANSPLHDAYESFRHHELTVGPVTLDLAHWISEGLLALFFFVVGLEVKRELVVGELRERSRAALPVVAALAGMVVPALVYVVVAWGAPGGGRGWAVPMATDIAFALGVLSIAHERYPGSLRVLLLSLAVVDDLGAILVIAIVFASGLVLPPLLAAAAVLAVYAVLQRRRVTAWWLYVPIAVLAWGLVHEAGIHATVAAVALGLLTRVRPDPGEEHAPGERLEHLLQPWSAGFVVPLFAFTAAGVSLSGDVIAAAAGSRIAVAVFTGLVVGKMLGIVGGIAAARRLGIASVPEGVRTYDTFSLGALGGVGFTVSLLLAELAFEAQTAELAKMSVLAASVFASVLAIVLLHLRRNDADDVAEADPVDAVPAG